jgi:hypothetical protein
MSAAGVMPVNAGAGGGAAAAAVAPIGTAIQSGDPAAVAAATRASAAALRAIAPAAAARIDAATAANNDTLLRALGIFTFFLFSKTGVPALGTWISWALRNPQEAMVMAIEKLTQRARWEDTPNKAILYSPPAIAIKLAGSRDPAAKRLGDRRIEAGIKAHGIALQLLINVVNYKQEYATPAITGNTAAVLLAYSKMIVCSTIRFNKADLLKNQLIAEVAQKAESMLRGRNSSVTRSNMLRPQRSLTSQSGFNTLGRSVYDPTGVLTQTIDTLPWQLREAVKLIFETEMADVTDLGEGPARSLGWYITNIFDIPRGGVRESTQLPSIKDTDAARALAEEFLGRYCEPIAEVDTGAAEGLLQLAAGTGVPSVRDESSGEAAATQTTGRNASRSTDRYGARGGYRKTRRNKRKTQSKGRKTRSKGRG